jgi:TonB family protein
LFWIIFFPNFSPGTFEMAEAKAKLELAVRSIGTPARKGSERGGPGAQLPPCKRDRRGWEDLESGLQEDAKASTGARSQAQVPAEVMAKLVTHRVDPDYPEAARPANLQGVIVLDVVVGRDGSVLDMRALNGPEMLAEAAKDALRWWRFEPYRIEGQPVAVETTVAVEFKP